MMNIQWLSTAIIATSFVTLVMPVSADVVVFTDRTEFENALSGFSLTTETFDSQTTPESLTGFGNDIGSGLTLDVSPDASSSVDGSSIEDFGFTGTGVFEIEPDIDEMLDGSFGSGRINFSSSVIAVGFDFAAATPDNTTATSIDAEEVVLAFDGENFLVSDLLGLTTDGISSATELSDQEVANGFIGFVFSDAISELTFIHAGNIVPGGVDGGVESIFLDNVTFAAVPEPSSIALLAFGGIGLLGRRLRNG